MDLPLLTQFPCLSHVSSQALVSFFNQRLDDARISEGGGGAASRSNSSSLTHSASGPGLPTLSPSAAAVAGGAGGSWSVGKVLSLVASSAYYFRPDRLCHAFPELRCEKVVVHLCDRSSNQIERQVKRHGTPASVLCFFI